MITLAICKQFWSKIKETNPDKCWNWTHMIGVYGYGHFMIDKFSYRAHRVSYALAYGSLKNEDCVLHKYDNRACVNPTHLFTGSRKDNTHDMIMKGRKAIIPKILSSKEIKEAKALYVTNQYTQEALAKRFNVARVTMHRVLRDLGPYGTRPAS